MQRYRNIINSAEMNYKGAINNAQLKNFKIAPKITKIIFFYAQ